MNHSDRHIAQSLATLCEHMSTWTKLADDGFLVCNKLVTLHLGKRAAATDPDPVPIDRLVLLLEAREAEMREWKEKLESLVQLLQSTYARLVDALTATRAMLLARQLSNQDDNRAAQVIRIDTLHSLLLAISAMFATDLATKLDFVSTLSSLVSSESASAAPSPFGLPPAFPPEGTERELLVRMLGHWMYSPAVRQAQVQEVREVAKVLGARALVAAKDR